MKQSCHKLGNMREMWCWSILRDGNMGIMVIYCDYFTILPNISTLKQKLEYIIEKIQRKPNHRIYRYLLYTHIFL